MISRKLVFVLGLLVFLALPFFSAPAFAHPNAVLTVNVAGDYFPDGCDAEQCLLREAIIASNATPGIKETIEFNIPDNSTNCNNSTSVCTIRLLAALPEITDPVTIDGYTQPGAQPNTLNVGNNAELRIVLDAEKTITPAALHVTAGDTTLRGLVIQHAPGAGIFLESNGNLVTGNFIGTNATGTEAEGNWAGVMVKGMNNTIGGTTPAARNLVSGGAAFGLLLDGAVKTSIFGNYIGTNRHGLGAIPNNEAVYIQFGGDNVVGDKSVGARNIISGNQGNGVFLLDTHDNLIKGNYIGLGANKKGALGNNSNGIWLWGDASPFVRSNTIAQNKISNNGGAGILIGHAQGDLSVDNTITRNAIHSNGKLGIDLFPENVNNPNDAGDGDDGANHLQNTPKLSKVRSENGSTTIKGKLKSIAKHSYRIELFVNKQCQDSGHGEGKKYFGSVTVTTNEQGVASFTFTKHKPLAVGTAITATATEIVNALPKSTSEFSECEGAQ